MAIFIRSKLEKEIERIKRYREKTLGRPMNKTDAVWDIVIEYRKRHDY